MQLVKLKNNSIRVAIAGIALFLVLAAISSLGVLNIPDFNELILSGIAVTVIFIEVGLVNALGKGGKGLDIFGAFGVVSGIVILVTLGLSLAGMSVAALEAIRGFVFAIVAISFLIETFAR